MYCYSYTSLHDIALDIYLMLHKNQYLSLYSFTVINVSEIRVGAYSFSYLIRRII